ncbi:CobW family GTP-binding protein [Methyloversatilis universalis]|uniref:CobW family GTP-binding protein n=1 Tax=Methyloversatilis universalis TaxID=378211 RepID=UPI000371C09E|nr:GTP-binding protein [Methyloversatilis universalis]
MSAPRIPVVLLTGFLGAGKTTLLNRLLARQDMADTLVIINEYGDAALDHRLVTHAPEQVVTELAGGCVCCALRGDLAQTLREAHWRFARGGHRQFERVVIETTGLADPAPVLRTLATDPRIAERYRLACTLTVVDACQGEATIAAQPEALLQIAAADRLLIAKTDRAAPAQVAALQALLGRLNPFAQQTDLQAEALTPALLTPPGTLRLRSLPPPAAEQVHAVRSDSFTVDTPLAPERVQAWLDAWPTVAGPALLRMKAVLDIAGEARAQVVHGVQHTLYPPDSLDAPANGSTVVCITRGMDATRLTQWLGILHTQ